jgi:nitroreductase
VVCIAGKLDNPWAPFDCALAAGTLLLAAAAFNLGTTYCGLDEEREKKARAVVGLPNTYFLHALIPVGYPAEVKHPHTKYNPDRVHWDRFDSTKPETVTPH